MALDLQLEDGGASTAADVLGNAGAFAASQAGFAARPAQQALAAAIEEAIASRACLIAEAGTGIGKTYAYLVPALLSGRRVIISTGTKALQDQLFRRDLPRVCASLGLRPRSALLKGRGNYVCLYRLEQSWKEGGRHGQRADADLLAQLREFTARSRDGDLDGFAPMAQDNLALRLRVTSSRDNCLGGECPDFADCFVVKARRAAQDADVVVVNHHLLLADFALKQEGFGEILPGAATFVIDEAHQFPETAAQFLGTALSDSMLREWAADLLVECGEVTGALALVRNGLDELEARLRRLRLAMDSLPQRAGAEQVLDHAQASEHLAGIDTGLTGLAAVLSGLAGSSPGMDNLGDRLLDLRKRLRLWCDERGAIDDLDGAPDSRSSPTSPTSPSPDRESGHDHAGYGPADHEAHQPARPPAIDRPRLDIANGIRWYELSQRGFRLVLTPLSVAEPLAQFRQQSRAAWIHTSATLAVAGDFSLFQRRLGLLPAPLPSAAAPWQDLVDADFEDAEPSLVAAADSANQPPLRTLNLDSPFDYARQALLYLPAELPEPNSPQWLDAISAELARLVTLSGGRALLLFTSHRVLQHVARVLPRHSDYPLFVQGRAGKHQLLEDFRKAGNGILLGAASFWEGVDVPGPALSLVAIDKLPFAAPDDPVLTARMAAIRAEGGDPFNHWQLPQAALMLKQGVGRLIRSVEDRGVVAVLDRRLHSRGYGRRLLAALPPMRRSQRLADVADFFQEEGQSEPAAG
ncbi:MAG: ATP-dependent DNA helicase [Xanthomonadales bacterium]|nr:ATP-dependent DNA helicase [Xanthomonadales bacterium]